MTRWAAAARLAPRQPTSGATLRPYRVLRVPSSRPETAREQRGPAGADHPDQGELGGTGEHQQRECARLPHAEPARDRDRAEGDPVGTGRHAHGDAVPDDRPGVLLARHQVASTRAVCSLTCLTVVVPSPRRSSVRCAPSGPQPALGQECPEVVVLGGQPRHGMVEPVGDQGVGTRLEQARTVAGTALVRVDGQVGELSGGDRVAVGVLRGTRHDEAGDQVALERDQHPVAGVVGAAERVAPGLGDGVRVERLEDLGGQQLGVRRPPGAHLHGRDRGGVVGPRDAGGDVSAGHVPIQPSGPGPAPRGVRDVRRPRTAPTRRRC